MSRIVENFAFFPPQPSYGIEVDKGTGKQRLAVAGVDQGERGQLSMLRTRKGNTICAVYVKHPSASLSVLFSHGNACDLGQMFGFLTMLSHQLAANVMGYDYSGYGLSTGEPSEENTYADIEAAYSCLRQTYRMREDNIILFGHSLGSGPTVELAKRLPLLRAVILQSALLSAFRVVFNLSLSLPFDIFKNFEKIQLINCPVLVIHGTRDRVIDVSHGKQLYQLCKKKYEPLWIKGGDHNNLPTEFEAVFFQHLKKFISSIQ